MKLVNTTYNSPEDMIKKLQQITGKTNLKIYKNISSFYNKMDMRMDGVTFARIAQGNNKIYHEVFLLMKLLQTKTSYYEYEH